MKNYLILLNNEVTMTKFIMATDMFGMHVGRFFDVQLEIEVHS